MDQQRSASIKLLFGFDPDTSSKTTADTIEATIIRLKLEELAKPWQEAHDRITGLRAKYERGDCPMAIDEALRDQVEVVMLDEKRDDAWGSFKTAAEAATAAGYVLPKGNDIKAYCRLI